MKDFSIFGNAAPHHITSCIEDYFEEVGKFRKKYPYLREYELLPLLMPTSMVLLETKAGRNAAAPLRTRALTALGRIHASTVGSLIESLNTIGTTRDTGKVTVDLLTTCTHEFLSRFRICPETVRDKLTCAATALPHPHYVE